MTQNAISLPTIGTLSGLQLVQKVNDAFASFASAHGGAARPSYAVSGTIWVKGVSATAHEVYYYDGVDDILIGTVNPTDNTFTPLVAASQAEMEAGTEAALRSMSPLRVAQAIAKLESPRGLLYKADPLTVAFSKTGAGAAEIKAGTRVEVAGKQVVFAAATAITMPTLTAGTDYAIWVKDDGTAEASASFTTPPAAGNWRKIGGFHYAPGQTAPAQAGGDTTPSINAYSFWDVRFRPACPDPRGMTLVADSFWADIYLLGVDHLTNGTSKYNVTIADGISPPKVPTKFGGNGTAAYSSLNWWEAGEVMRSHGKRLPTYDEFAALAYGTTEASSAGTDPASTILRAAYTSRWGVMLASGNMWVWGNEFGGGAAAASWAANTVGRGSTYQMENALVLGGNSTLSTNSGSRATSWDGQATTSSGVISARGVCDHQIIE